MAMREAPHYISDAGGSCPQNSTKVIMKRALLCLSLMLAAGPAFAQLDLTPKLSAPGAAASAPAAETSQTLIERINRGLNASPTLVSDFTQVSADGRRRTGRLYVLRPGKLRFDYNPPSQLEVVADGSNVAVIDKRVPQQDVYGINQTPLKFLTRADIDIARDTKVVGVRREKDEVILDIEDRNTVAGTSKIRIQFNGETFMIKTLDRDRSAGRADDRRAGEPLDQPAAGPQPVLHQLPVQCGKAGELSCHPRRPAGPGRGSRFFDLKGWIPFPSASLRPGMTPEIFPSSRSGEVRVTLDAKPAIRKRILARRDALSPEWRAMASRDIARQALSAAASGPGGPVAGYWPFRSEGRSTTADAEARRLWP